MMNTPKILREKLIRRLKSEPYKNMQVVWYNKYIMHGGITNADTTKRDF